jgi:hypothetical protein
VPERIFFKQKRNVDVAEKFEFNADFVVTEQAQHDNT